MSAHTESELFEQAYSYTQKGHSAQAMATCEELLRQYPSHLGAWNLLASEYYSIRDFDESIKTYINALSVHPNSNTLLNNLAAVQCCVSHFEDALHNVNKALNIDPNNNSALMNLEIIIDSIETKDRSFLCKKSKRKILSLSYRKLGNAYHNRGLSNKAIGCLETAIELSVRNDKPDLYNELYIVYSRLKNYELALACINKALAISSNHIGIISNKGYLHYLVGDFLAAETEYKKALNVQPNYAPARINMATLRLLKRDYLTAWPDYEYRLKLENVTEEKKTLQLSNDKKLKRQNIVSKNVLVLSEQGLGDFIQFSRYLPALKNRVGTNGQIYVMCPGALLCLYSNWSDDYIFVSRFDDVDFDYYIYILSLPGYMKTIESSIPPASTLPSPINGTTNHLFKSANSDDKHIGLVWAGNPSHSRDIYRSIPFEYYEIFSAVKNTVFHSLQFGGHGHKCPLISTKLNILDHCADLKNFTDTALLLKQLDLVICIDTSVAHLSATLGVETWLLVSYVPDWRWGLTGSSTKWYPSVRIFRQKNLNDWGSVIQDVTIALDDAVNK